MADVVAKISLDFSGVYRGVVTTAVTARAIIAHNNGDVLQISGLSRYYVYNSTSTVADNGTTVIKPDDVFANGRWVCNTTFISGYEYISLTLQGSALNLGDGVSISTYEWVLVDTPTGGAQPSVLLVPSGSQAILKIPVDDNGWRPGGNFVFLRITNDVGQQSSSDPFDPRVPTTASLVLSNATNLGFIPPPAGARNWHVQYRETLKNINTAIDDVAGLVPGASQPTADDKKMSPSGSTAGNGAIVPGISISNTPASGGYVRVYANGIGVSLANGGSAAATVAAGYECFFSGDAGATARLIADIVAADVLVWNGGVAGYDVDTVDIIDFDYMEVV
jgi:hypothetical protein